MLTNISETDRVVNYDAQHSIRYRRPPMTKPPDRHARRREATRTKLIEAAKALIARQGVDNTRIQEITDEADVGFGSFYNHFESKEAIIEAVLADTVAAQGA